MQEIGVTDIYTVDKGETYHRARHGISDIAFKIVSGNRASFYSKYINQDDKVLEFGTGPGWNLVGLQCNEKHAYDISTYYAEFFEKNKIEFYSNISKVPKSFFDVVICSHVLEHVPNPLGSLMDIRDTLKDNGLLILSIPSDISSKYDKYNKSDKDHHLFSWNIQTICTLVEASDFEVLKYFKKPHGGAIFLANFFDRFNLPKPFFNFSFRVINLFYSSKEIVVIAKKNEDIPK